MTILTEILKYFNAIIEQSKLYERVYGLSEYSEKEKRYIRYLGDGQYEILHDFDRYAGTFFWVKSGKTLISPARNQIDGCMTDIQVLFNIRAVSVIQKRLLKCDGADDADYVALTTLKLLQNSEKKLQNVLGLKSIALNGVSYEPKITGIENDKNYSQVSIDFQLIITAKQECFNNDICIDTSSIPIEVIKKACVNILVEGQQLPNPLTANFVAGNNVQISIDIDGNIVISGIGGVQSVTGLDTDNTDPANPVVQIAVDGVTITGDGTAGNPLVSTAIASVYTADNGLTENPAGNFQWGGQLIQNTVVDGQALYQILFQSLLNDKDKSFFKVDVTGQTIAIHGVSSAGIAGLFEAINATALLARSVNNSGLIAEGGLMSFIRVTRSSGNDIFPVLELARQTSGTPSVGMGARFVLHNQVATGITVGVIIDAVVTSISPNNTKYTLAVALNGSYNVRHEILSNGQHILNAYGLGTFTGTPAFMLGVDASGNVIEVSGGVQTVTGLDTDNTDPANPVVQIAVDGVTITGDGTSGNPLVGASSFALTIKDEGTTIDSNVDEINFIDSKVTQTAAGKVDVTVEGYQTFLYEFYNY
jgi:hypothetical protein